MTTIHKTRYKSLGYYCAKAGMWQLVATDVEYFCPIGVWYATKAELLADLDSVATWRGME